MKEWNEKTYYGRKWDAVEPGSAPNLGIAAVTPGSHMAYVIEEVAQAMDGANCLINRLCRAYGFQVFVQVKEGEATVRLTHEGVWYKRDLTTRERKEAQRFDYFKAEGLDYTLYEPLEISFDLGSGDWYQMPGGTTRATGKGPRRSPAADTRKAHAAKLRAAANAAAAA